MIACNLRNLKGALLLFLITTLPFIGTSSPRNVAAASETLCAAGQKCLFLPIMAHGGPNVDLILKGIEITQAVQDENNGVPLVEGRSTKMRIYAVIDGSSKPVENIRISVTAKRSSKVLSAAPRDLFVRVPLSNSRSDYASTINISLPDAWLSGIVDMKVSLDADNKFAEADEYNNTIIQQLVFNRVPVLRVMVVPVTYTHTPDGHTYPAPNQDTLSDWINRTYPVSKLQLTWHTPYKFTGDLGMPNEFSRLLNEVTAIKMSESAPEDTIYYGLVPTTDSESTWFNGGIAGIGWIGLRGAVGLDVPGGTSQIAAHEIGHNLGLAHSPCGVSGDPNYPYANGSIGQYGLDVKNGNVYGPTSAKDMMSYCNPKWISDYTYRSLFKAQKLVANTVDPASGVGQAGVQGAPSTRSLLVRAEINANGARLLPAYVLTGQVVRQPAFGEYEVQVLDSQGAVVARSNVQAYQNGEAEQGVMGIHTMLALPDRPAALVRLLKDGQVLAEQALQSAPANQRNAVQVQKMVDSANLLWTAGSQPALLRYSKDGGQTWTTLSVDLKGGQMSIPAGLLDEDGIFDVVVAGTWK